MSEENGSPPASMPVLDFKRVPRRRFHKQWTRLTNRVSKLQLAIQRLSDEVEEARAAAEAQEKQQADAGEETSTAGKESRADLLKKQEQIVEMMDELEYIAGEQERLLSEVVVSVPDEWWHESAPAGLDLSDPDSYEWLADGRYEELLGMVQAEPKNWLTPTS